ncbi:MAG: polyprenyl synthetase family protein [Euryarchaeota archaeon]|nr:polyprenyl synthetase family protein [Euryarchaeota archaeon]
MAPAARHQGDRMTQEPALSEALRPYRARLESEMVRGLPPFPSGTPDPAHVKPDETAPLHPLRHVIDAGGKRLRPLLTMLACEAVCEDADRALPTAAGLELLHTFTLVHDDVMDNDLTRRGRPTVHALWGGPLAICAGDALYAFAFDKMAQNLGTARVTPETIVHIMRRAAEVSYELSAGQTQDLLFEKRDDVTLDEYLEMIRLKTGVLIQLSVEAGARIGGGDTEQVAALSDYGRHIGLAFQIVDDLLDLVADEAELGKPVGSDIRAGKKTYPVLHALDHLGPADRARLLDILTTPEPETTPTMVQEGLSLLVEADSMEAAKVHATREVENARAALGRLDAPGGSAIALLARVADYMITRRN